MEVKNWGKIGKGSSSFDPNELFLSFGGLNDCAKFHQNQIKIATIETTTDRR